MSKRILFFAYSVSPLCFRAQSAKNMSAICHIQFQWKVLNRKRFRNRIKKMWIDRAKIALGWKYLELKNTQIKFYFLYVKLAYVQIWGQSNKFPLTCSSLKWWKLVKNRFEKRALKKFCCVDSQTNSAHKHSQPGSHLTESISACKVYF